MLGEPVIFIFVIISVETWLHKKQRRLIVMASMLHVWIVCPIFPHAGHRVLTKGWRARDGFGSVL